MASLPSIPALPGLRRARKAAAQVDRPAEQPAADPRLLAAARLRDEDRARRATSIAPPAARR